MAEICSLFQKYQVANYCKIYPNIHIFLLHVLDNQRNINLNIIPLVQVKAISSYKNPFDRQKRLLARSFLFEYCKLFYGKKDFNIITNRYGKLKFMEDIKINFNFSYACSYVLIGISSNRDLGVDIEYINVTIPFMDISKLIMNNEELHFMTGTKKKEFFYYIFTKKEALIKASGQKTGNLFDINLLQYKNYCCTAFPLSKDYIMACSYKI